LTADEYSALEADRDAVYVAIVFVSTGTLDEGKTSMLKDGITGLTSVDEDETSKVNEAIGIPEGKDQVNVPLVDVAGKPGKIPVLEAEADCVHVVSLYELNMEISATYSNQIRGDKFLAAF
jgi:hypothetical protein